MSGERGAGVEETVLSHRAVGRCCACRGSGAVLRGGVRRKCLREPGHRRCDAGCRQSASLSPERGVRPPRRAAEAPSDVGAAPAVTAVPRVGSDGCSTRRLAACRTSTALPAATARDHFNQEFEPPDQGLCAGNGFVIDMVNSAYTVYKPNGGRQWTVQHQRAVRRGPDRVHERSALLLRRPDQHVVRDDSVHQRRRLRIPRRTSHLDIAVNSPNGPTVNGRPAIPPTRGSSTRSTRLTQAVTAVPCFGDQPRIGIDSQNLYVTDDEFSINGPQFDGGEIYAFSKKDLVALNPTVHFARFPHLSVGGTIPLAPQPG